MNEDELRFVFETELRAVPTLATVVADGEKRHVFVGGEHRVLLLVDPLAHAGIEETHGGHLVAPMSGTVVAVMVKAGDKVEQGAPLMILEAMKMEHTINAPRDGSVASINCTEGELVQPGVELVTLNENPG